MVSDNGSANYTDSAIRVWRDVILCSVDCFGETISVYGFAQFMIVDN